jgi:hypothetical protein
MSRQAPVVFIDARCTVDLLLIAQGMLMKLICELDCLSDVISYGRLEIMAGAACAQRRVMYV